jgi:hypothetical protein
MGSSAAPLIASRPRNAAYIGSLSEFGNPRALPRNGYLLERAVSGVPYRGMSKSGPRSTICHAPRLEPPDLLKLCET